MCNAMGEASQQPKHRPWCPGKLYEKMRYRNRNPATIRNMVHDMIKYHEDMVRAHRGEIERYKEWLKNGG